MVSAGTLERAVSQGIITAEQAERLRQLEAPATLVAALPPEDPEKLRFISGFGDIFVTLGILLFLFPAGYFANLYGGSLLLWPTVAVLAWLLAELFTRRRRMALPSITLLVIFVGSGFGAFFFLFDRLGGGHPTGQFGLDIFDATKALGITVVMGALAAVILAGLHYWRFRVPITIAAGAAALCLAILAGILMAFPGLSFTVFNSLILACGIALFLVAMRFDMSDPDRSTRRTDIAFWLHLLAAPLIVHPLISGFLGGFGTLDQPHAIGILAVFLGLGIVAIIVDRRAMLVSGLVYAGIAFGSLIQKTGVGSALEPITILVLGAFVLALSAGWQRLRRAFLLCLPADLAKRLPHPLVVPV